MIVMNPSEIAKFNKKQCKRDFYFQHKKEEFVKFKTEL